MVEQNKNNGKASLHQGIACLGVVGPVRDENNGSRGTITVRSSGNFAAKSQSANSQKVQFAAESVGFGWTAATPAENFAADSLQMQQTRGRRSTDDCGGQRRR
jgi:hypothetical protein